MVDVGLTHIALPVTDIEQSIQFYSAYAGMQVMHRRIDAGTGVAVVWLSDCTRPFVIVLIQSSSVHGVLSPLAHLGVGCQSREFIDSLCEKARQEGVLLQEPKDSGYPIGYWAFLRDPDGHTLELSYGQEIGLTVEQTLQKDAVPEIKQMPSATLIRLGGLAAILAGILRGVNSFIPSSAPSSAIAILYLLTDIFILFGIIGIYGFLHQESRLWGFFGFLLAIIGIAMIRTGGIAGVNLYPIGALSFTVGLSLFAVGSWIARKLPQWVSIFWVLSMIVGFSGYFIPSLNLLFVISGIIFGIGFAGAGIKMWSATKFR